MHPTTASGLRAAGRACWLLACLALAGCGGGQQVTPEAVSQARQTWKRAGIRDYDLEWTSSGRTAAHYLVYVRRGKVERINAIQPNGVTVTLHPARPEFFGVDGLFQVIEDELAQVKSDSPFGRPKGTQAVLTFEPDPKLGYPRTYRRDVLGTPQGVAIDVLKFVPNPPEPVPAPSVRLDRPVH